ncbi:MAG TPA: Nif3-like dinuclear metal center hexameric protein [Candidatus Limnocylindria bacterium]|nr:Nif3-like dinuclear metal center hexameric protein [Candidatus Limnocylindria bacterium]
MATASLPQIVAHCDTLLRTSEINDYDGAVNGLQVENRGNVSRIAAAVDASITTIRMAIAARANLLVVHHGLFWNKRQPWTGVNYEMLRLLLANDVAIYSSHLPLDMHPKLGNNAQLCAALGFRNAKPFFRTKDQLLGLRVTTNVSRRALTQQLRHAANGEVKVIPGGPETCRQIGVVTGGAGAEVKLAASEGVDTFITGEGPHWTYALAEELGVNILYGGHYATETFGVKAFAAHLSKKFRVSWVFVDHPSGL